MCSQHLSSSQYHFPGRELTVSALELSLVVLLKVIEAVGSAMNEKLVGNNLLLMSRNCWRMGSVPKLEGEDKTGNIK